MSITFETQPVGGEFAPTNVVAAWVEDAQGNFVKTVVRHSAIRTIHLVAWNAAAGPGDMDAVSGATRLNHVGTVTAEWDGTDGTGAMAPDGAYTIRIEVADENSTQAGQNHQGTFTFTKDGVASTDTQQGIGIVNVVLDYSGRTP